MADISMTKANSNGIKRQKTGIMSKHGEIMSFTFGNIHGTEMKAINYGGIISSLIFADKKGRMRNIVAGFENPADYLNRHPYFGAIAGRYANRIKNAEFELKGKKYRLAANNNGNHLHGGIEGFDKKIWHDEIINSGRTLKLSLLSPDGEEGYPGNLRVCVLYTLSPDNRLIIEYSAETDAATHLNLTNHSYFNLNGFESGISAHSIMINSDFYTEPGPGLIPTGRLLPVPGTPFDFREKTLSGERLASVEGGFDHNFVLNKNTDGPSVRAETQESGIVLEMFTTEPGVQFYTGNFLDGSLSGKGGIKYNKHCAFCLEAQHYPDSPNQPDFPSTVLEPGSIYSQKTEYALSLSD